MNCAKVPLGYILAAIRESESSGGHLRLWTSKNELAIKYVQTVSYGNYPQYSTTQSTLSFTVPSKPLQNVSVHGTHWACLIKWGPVPPCHRHGVMQGVYITYGLLGDSSHATKRLNDNGTDYNISTLLPYSTYWTTVTPFNRVGNGTEYTINCTTPEEGESDCLRRDLLWWRVIRAPQVGHFKIDQKTVPVLTWF